MAGRSQNKARDRGGQDPGGLLRHDKLERSLRHESGDLGIRKWGRGGVWNRASVVELAKDTYRRAEKTEGPIENRDCDSLWIIQATVSSRDVGLKTPNIRLVFLRARGAGRYSARGCF